MIALSSPVLSLMPVTDALTTVSKDFVAWEIVAEGRHFLPDIEKELRELLPSYHLEVSVHTPLSDVNIGSLNDRMRQAALSEVLRCIEVAGRMGFGPFTLHPGFYTPLGSVYKEGAWQATKESLRILERAGKEHGVKLALENMPSMPISMVTSPEELLHLLEGLEMGICLDIGHANTTKNIDRYLALKDRIANVHVHDNDGRWDQHLAIGKGNIDFHHVLSKLNGYGGRYVIEARNLEDGPFSQARLRQIISGI